MENKIRFVKEKNYMSEEFERKKTFINFYQV